MRRVGNLYDTIADYDNLLLAYLKAIRGKRQKRDVMRFNHDFSENMNRLLCDIKEEKVVVGDYLYFYISDPKRRKICAAPLRERILHHAIMNVCHPIFDRNLIATTYATRKGKGQYQALNELKSKLGYYKVAVKLDYRKYFDSIDHETLKEILRRIIKDSRLLALFDKIIGSYCSAPGRGLPIGNLTSQYMANLYLSSLDHMMKEQLRVPVYVRYMDDIVMLFENRDKAKAAVDFIMNYSNDKLKLTLKPPIFCSCRDGVNFLGYKVMPHYLLLNGRSKRRFRTRLRYCESNLALCRWTEREYFDHIVPLMAFAMHAQSWKYRTECMKILG